MNKKCKMTIGVMLLCSTAFSANPAAAQTCAVPPTCESLGYDKKAEDCEDKAILKCPLDSSKIFCSNGSADGISPTPGYGGGTGPNGSYRVGDLLTCNGKSVGYVIEVNDTGASGRISSMDYENNKATFNKTTGNAHCKAKNSCNLAWELVRDGSEIGKICQAKGVSIDTMWSQSESHGYYAKMSSCISSSSTVIYNDVKNPTPIFCTAAFVSDKSSGGATQTTYKVGDTYVLNGVPAGKIVELDSTGQHGIVAFSGGTASASNANTLCSGKSVAGLNWALATGNHACKIITDAAIEQCALHTSSGSGYCASGGFNVYCSDTGKTAPFACEAPF